jgi:acyl carrier protein
MQNIVDGIIAWIEENINASKPNTKISPETPLLDEGLMTSLDYLHLVFFLEERHSIKFDIEELTPENFGTPVTIAALDERRMANP